MLCMYRQTILIPALVQLVILGHRTGYEEMKNVLNSLQCIFISQNYFDKFSSYDAKLTVELIQSEYADDLIHHISEHDCRISIILAVRLRRRMQICGQTESWRDIRSENCRSCFL